MDFKSVAVLGNGVPKLVWGHLDSKPYGVAFNFVGGSQKLSKWMSFGGLSVSSACRGIRSLEEDKSSKPANELQRLADQREQNVSKRSHKDLSLFPSALSY